jgi:exodeoxyribonuclease VII large subunit
LYPKKVYSLYDLSKSIQNLFRRHASQTYWVKAEILKLNFYEQSGHAYPDLVDKQNSILKAQFSGVIWKTNFDAINAKFKTIGEVLKDDITIVAKVNVNYNSVHGLSLNIVDIDTDYTLGELARQKQLSIRKLKEENLFNLNKTTVLPLLPKTIAVISVQSSKGFSDFEDVLANNPKRFRFHYKLFPSVLQGDRAITSISNQLKVISQHQNHFDAVAIIRGGGDELGFSAYDNYILAKSIANCPVPVLTGIGHSTNLTVSELVSYKSFITPTKLAEFFVEQFDVVEQKLQINITSLEKNALNNLNFNINNLQNVSKLFEIHTLNLLRHQSSVLNQQKFQLDINARHIFENQSRQLDFLHQKLKLLDPKQTLKRGFSITKLNGKAIFDSKIIKNGDLINTQFYKGEIESTVNKNKSK